MDHLFKILVFLSLLVSLCQPSLAIKKNRRLCPTECVCASDQFGRHRTLCEVGGMIDLIPVAAMVPETQVLIITGNEFMPNNLSLGPIFADMKKLEEIHLTWSGIPSLGEHSFWGLRNLRVLNLTQNSLTNLVDTNFRGATSLKLLDLSHNQIESVPSAVFRHIKFLQSLSLANNMIPKLVPRIFFGLTRLRYLDLSYNPLGDLQPELFRDVPVLETFHCAGCGLLSISGTLLNMMPELKELSLQNNRLTQVPHRIVVLQSLNVLKLDGNHIKFIEKGVVSGSPIQHLHLSHNHIIRLEPDAFGNSSITHLDLSYNRLTNVDSESISDAIDQIVDMRLSGNSLRIEDLLNILPEAENLRRLSIGDIGLTLLPAGLMHHSYSLDYLNVSANYLSVLPLDLFSSTPNLIELDLSYNSFRGLNDDVLEAIAKAKNLRVLGLKGNPFHCDKCHVAPLIRWLQNSPDQESRCDDPRVWSCLTCVGPKSFEGISLVLLPNGDIPECSDDSNSIGFSPPSNMILPGHSIVPSSYLNDASHPQSHLTRHKTKSFSGFFSEQLPLVIVCACALLIIILCFVIGGVIAYSRHSAFYYTNEKEFENTSYFVSDRQLMAPDHRNGNSTLLRNDHHANSNGTGNGSAFSPWMSYKNGNNKNNNNKISDRPHQENPAATIATIDELADIAGSTELVDSGAPLHGPFDFPQTTEITILETEPKPGTG